jgi:AraC-like DNA-binding protein
MARTATARDVENVGAYLDSVKSDAVSFPQVFDLLKSSLAFAEAVVISSLPRGGLQLCQPPHAADTLLRAYSRQLHTHDRLTWQSIAHGRAVRGVDAWPAGSFQTSEYFRDLMVPNGLAFAAAAPLSAPVLDGYAGAVHLYRTADQGAFTEEEMHRLTRFARHLDGAVRRVREARAGQSPSIEILPRKLDFSQFIFDSGLQPLLPQSNVSDLDPRLRASILEDARGRLEHVNSRDTSSDRVPLPDTRGDLWNFRVVSHRSLPALSEGPVVFYCLQPECSEWSLLRPSDFQADGELARLVPALKFMREQYRSGPTLVDIARAVHLSPFHFHRRFTELLGITPKHFMLDCQVQHAKKDLLSRQKNLVKIAADCGFAHQSHFTSRFKQATGLTPTHWRRIALESRNNLRG